MDQQHLFLELFNSTLTLQSQAIDILHALQNSLDETTQDILFKYYIPIFLQLIAIIISACMIFHQIRKQHENDLKKQREEIKFNLKLNLRSEINACIDTLNTTTSSATVFPYLLKNSFRG
jgi:sensor domain CHASE-containing protein